MIKYDLNDGALLAFVLAKIKHTMLYNLKLKSDAIKLESEIYHFSYKGKIRRFIEEIRYQHEYYFYECYWEEMFDTIVELLMGYVLLPKEFINTSLKSRLLEFYSYELDRLNNVLGIKEFAEKISISQEELLGYMKNHNKFPEPTQRLNNTPLWTVGQIEEFQIELELASNSDAKSVISNAFIRNNSVSDQSAYLESVDDDGFLFIGLSKGENLKVAEYLNKRMKNTFSSVSNPYLKLFIGEVYFDQRDWSRLKNHLEETKQEFETMYKDELHGSSAYICTLIQLAYVYTKVDVSNDLIEHLLAQARFYTIIYEGDIGIRAQSVFGRGLVAFQKWFEENTSEIMFIY